MTSNSRLVAIVTGASSGLGFEITRELVARDVPVLMVARRTDFLKEKARELQQSLAHNHAVYPVAADVGSPSDVKRIRQFMREGNLAVKWLINSAGVGRFGKIESYSYQDIESIFRANLIGTILMSQEFINEITDNGGVLCNVMSTSALNKRANETVYTAAKWGARGFTEALRAELKSRSVRVMAVYPGGMNTPFWDESRDYVPDPSQFMPPSAAAERIVNNMLDPDECQVSDLTINRL